MSAFKTIVCAISLIEHNEDIVYYTRELAKLGGAKVYVVHSLPSMDHLRQYMADAAVADDLVQGAEEKGLAYAKEFIAKNFSDLDAVPVCVQGDVTNQLLELVDKYCADIVIMGSMSTKGFFSFFQLKPSQNLLGKTRVPVMVIPNDLDMECTPKD